MVTTITPTSPMTALRISSVELENVPGTKAVQTAQVTIAQTRAPAQTVLFAIIRFLNVTRATKLRVGRRDVGGGSRLYVTHAFGANSCACRRVRISTAGERWRAQLLDEEVAFTIHPLDLPARTFTPLTRPMRRRFH